MKKVLIITGYTNHSNQQDLMATWRSALADTVSKVSDDLVVDATAYFDKDATGFSFSMNHGLAKAIAGDYDYCILLGNDGVPLRDDWVEKLIKAHEDTDAWIVCPTADNPPHSVYNHKKIVQKGPYTQYHMYPAICWLLPRKTILEIGFFDERFKGGCYEDDDYCLRVEKAGGTIVRTDNVMLHHKLSQTIGNMNVHELMSRNSAVYAAKWETVK